MNPFKEFKLSININRRDSSWVNMGAGDSGEGTRYLGQPFSRRQLGVVIFVVVVGFFLIIVRAAELQVWQGGYYRDLAEGNRSRIHTVLAPRGLIYDRYGRILVENVPRMSVALVPFDVPKDEALRTEIFTDLSEATGILIEEINAVWDNFSSRRKKSLDPYLLKTNLSLEEGLKLRVWADKWPGVVVLTNPRRAYSSVEEGTKSLSHILGYVGQVTNDDLQRGLSYAPEDVIGRAGLEFVYDETLRGKNGRREVEVNALGIEQKIFAETAPVSGKNLWLTIDFDLQQKAEEALRRGLSRTNSNRGAVVVLDPSSGEVLALVSLPAFDSNQFTLGFNAGAYEKLINDTSNPLFNRVVQGSYPSGSTIKPIIAVAALAEGIITPNTHYLSTGGIRVSRWFFPDWKAGGHGSTNVRKALAESVNTFFYIIGGGYDNLPGLGISLIERYAREFGLGQITKIDLPGETAGLVPNPEWKQKVKKERWYIGNTYYTAIGQGDVLVTPLQVAVFTSIFANGGFLYRPHLVLEEEGREQSQSYQPIAMEEKIINPKVMGTVRQGLRDAVMVGSARALSSLPITVAGKTGTAEIGGTRKPHAWFTGFAPYDKPALSITVLLEEAGEGSSYAVPVAKEILEWWAQNRQES